MKVPYNPEPRKNLIDEQICRLHKERHPSQRSLVAKLQVFGYSFSGLTILRIEKGQGLVTDIELKILCDYFSVKPNQMLRFDN